MDVIILVMDSTVNGFSLYSISRRRNWIRHNISLGSTCFLRRYMDTMFVQFSYISPRLVSCVLRKDDRCTWMDSAVFVSNDSIIGSLINNTNLLIKSLLEVFLFMVPICDVFSNILLYDTIHASDNGGSDRDSEWRGCLGVALGVMPGGFNNGGSVALAGTCFGVVPHSLGVCINVARFLYFVGIVLQRDPVLES